RIGEVPRPRCGQGGAPNQVLGGLPQSQEFAVPDEPVDCFTWNFKDFGEVHGSFKAPRPLPAGHGALAFRAQAVLALAPFFRCARSSMRAAGVMPSSRAACPKFSGRCRSSLWRSSAERPGRAAKAKSEGMAMPSSLRKDAM